MTLPDFPDGTRFLSVKGVPVSRSFDDLLHPRAWDVPRGRPFPLDEYMRCRNELSEDAFRDLVARSLDLAMA